MPKGKLCRECAQQGKIAIFKFEFSLFFSTYPPLHMYFYVVCEVCALHNIYYF